MTERDANQLAADVREAVGRLNVYCPNRVVGVEQTAKAVAALDELVALVGTLQQERDEWKLRAETWLDATEEEIFVRERRERERAEAAEAALATTRQALERLTVAIEDVQRANDAWENPDGTRMTVTERDHIMAEAKIAVLDARRALTDTGGDTARYGCVADCRADAGAGLHSPDCRVPPAGGDTKPTAGGKDAATSDGARSSVPAPAVSPDEMRTNDRLPQTPWPAGDDTKEPA